MNRTIKFRVWDTIEKTWFNNIGMSKNNILCSGKESRFHIMQFTGLTDKNGVEIYEGDILSSSDKYSKLKVKVVYEGLCFRLIGINEPFYWNFNNEFEVIGNIHEKE